MDCVDHGEFIIQGSPHGKKYCPEPKIPIFPSWDTIPKTGTGQPFSFIDDLEKVKSYFSFEFKELQKSLKTLTSIAN